MNNRSMFVALALGLSLSVALMWLLGGLPAARAASYTVCPAGSPTCGYSVIQDAVDAAGDGDVIKVAAGTYNDVNHYYGLEQVVYIAKSVTIRGGYTTAFTEPPDPEANPTTLDAGGQGRVMYIEGNISLTIEGLRITGGDATVLGGDEEHGGGVSIRNATATLRNNQVFNNTAYGGGGLWLVGSDATLIGNTVISNTAVDCGGGLSLADSVATINGNTVISNTSGGCGGGVNVWECDNVTLTGNTISANSTDWGGGGVRVGRSDATLVENIISSNTSSGDGGGLFLNSSDATLSGNTISSNSADWGGGLFLNSSDATLSGNTVSSNTAVWNGGGLVVDYSAATLTDNTISANSSGWGGGGLNLWQSPATLSGNTISSNSADLGGGLSLKVSAATLTNNVIADNQAGTVGSGLYITGSLPSLLHTTIARNTGGDGVGLSIGDNSTVAMTNTIIVSHTVGIHVDPGSTAILESTLWGNGLDWEVEGTLIRSNDHWGNPDFVDPDNGDYHIGENSAAIDAGVDAGVTNDIDFHPRPYLIPDLGADEYWPPGALKFIYLPLVRKSPVK